MGWLLLSLIFLVQLLLIPVILLQKGRGGGLAGALGGMGGQSAFGTKAGDVFTRITVVIAGIWIVLCIAAQNFYEPNNNPLKQTRGATANSTKTNTAPESTGSSPAPTGAGAAPVNPGPAADPGPAANPAPPVNGGNPSNPG